MGRRDCLVLRNRLLHFRPKCPEAWQFLFVVASEDILDQQLITNQMGFNVSGPL